MIFSRRASIFLFFVILEISQTSFSYELVVDYSIQTQSLHFTVYRPIFLKNGIEIVIWSEMGRSRTQGPKPYSLKCFLNGAEYLLPFAANKYQVNANSESAMQSIIAEIEKLDTSKDLPADNDGEEDRYKLQ